MPLFIVQFPAGNIFSDMIHPTIDFIFSELFLNIYFI